MNDRAPHWIRHNKQERLPPRMIALDTEAWREDVPGGEVQRWRMGCAVRWRTNLKSGDRAEGAAFSCPDDLWKWVSEYCRPATRTVVWCHNLGYDARISQVFTMLPKYGFELEWCNLDRNVSSMTWRSDHGTLVFADTWTWLPMKLEMIAPHVGSVKFTMPRDSASDEDWETYCMRDAEIVYHVVDRLNKFLVSEGLGNWQPTGAGMAMTTWRHKFMTHKVLVHDDMDALEAERLAMYTGRAEAWKHGKLPRSKWTEVDIRNAYLTIASDTPLPRKLHMETRSLSMRQYGNLRKTFNLLCYCEVETDTPVLPYRSDGKILWPVGNFSGWYWDNEVDLAVKYGARIKIRRSRVYVSDPILQAWATWVLGILDKNNDSTDPIVRTWIKHCGRALIGRLALRTPTWEVFGTNPDGITGITHVTFPEENYTTRLLHVGNTTLIETARTEGKDSLPQITGYIMAECRVRLWEMMQSADLRHLAHVDTDSVLVDSTGLAAMRERYHDSFDRLFAVKGTYRKLEVYAPRSYRRDGDRVTAGIPARAQEGPDGVIRGERWASLSSDLNTDGGGTVSVLRAEWRVNKTDPRRMSAAGAGCETEAYSVGVSSVMSESSMPSPGVGS